MKGMNLIGITFGMVFLINACMYSDNGVYTVDPVEGDPPVVHAVTSLDTIDQAVVNDSLEVFYEVSIQNGELYILDVLIGNAPIYDSDTTSGSFWIYFFDVQQPGIDTLRMNFYYSSNTNSLADVLGVEARDLGLKYAIDFKWTVK